MNFVHSVNLQLFDLQTLFQRSLLIIINGFYLVFIQMGCVLIPAIITHKTYGTVVVSWVRYFVRLSFSCVSN